MTDSVSFRPAYRGALVAMGLVLLGYLITLAPTVTFWDAGEFIAAAKILGIPHPPGTPLFVLLAHVWGLAVPLGEYAWRLNLMSAVFSAAGAGLFYLVAHESLRRAVADVEPGLARLLTVGGALAAALAAAFGFTQWQNSVETEVYSIATFSIAALCWLCFVWRARRQQDGAARILLLAVYLLGVSMGNHLLVLLAGPAVVAFVAATLWHDPARDPATRRREWAQAAVLAGIWALLVGIGLGSTGLIVVGGICFVLAAAFASSAGALPFALAAAGIVAIGVTTYLFLYIRAGQQPMLNEADPSTWDALLAVIRRAQYPVRTPLDDPTVLHGPDNPGRTLSLLGMQLVNYVQYFDWQWAKSIPGLLADRLPVRTLFTAGAFYLGLRGAVRQYRSDRAGWWLLLVLFAITGLGLVLYMNFKPGFSLFYNRYPDPEHHEVRERDYFFVASFLVWGVWVGMGLADLARGVAARIKAGMSRQVAVVGLLGLGLVPFAGNFTAASRRHGQDATLAADFAYNLLNSVPPYGILFTYGDNDTFPLWWAQEVAGIRQDVTIVCLALANTDWYIRQLRDQPTRPFDEAAAPAIWQGRDPVRPDWPLHTMTEAEIQAAYPQRLSQAVTVRFGPISSTLPAGTVLYTNDFPAIRVIQQNLGRRPIVWGITSGRDYYGLDRYLVQQGLAIRLETSLPDSTSPGLDGTRLNGTLLDVPTTDRLVWQTYRYGALLTRPVGRLESTSRMFAGALSLPLTQLAYAYEAQGDLAKATYNLEQAGRLAPNPAIQSTLNQLRLRLWQQESAVSPPAP